MEILSVALIIAGVLYYLYDKDKKDREFSREKDNKVLEAFEKTLSTVFLTTEGSTKKFIEVIGDVMVEHFKQLEEKSDKERALLGDMQDRFFETLKEFKPLPVEQITRIDEHPVNEIEKEENFEDPLEDVSQIPIRDGINVQLDGEEEIHPISIS